MDKEFNTEKERIVDSISKPFLRPIMYGQIIFALAFFASPFIWIWHSWLLAWKIGLSSFMALLILYFIKTCVKEAANDVVNDEIKKQLNDSGKSRFIQKMEAKMNEAKRNNQQ